MAQPSVCPLLQGRVAYAKEGLFVVPCYQARTWAGPWRSVASPLAPSG